MNRLHVAASLLLGCSLTLTGCSSSSSPSPDAKGSTAGPSIPAYAQPETEKGAENFANYWVKTLNAATDSGNTKQLKALAADTCDDCANFAQTLDQIYGKGGHVESDGWQVLSIVPVDGQPKNAPGLQVNVEATPQKVYPSAKGKPKSYPGGKQNLRMFLTRKDGHWLVERLNV